MAIGVAIGTTLLAVILTVVIVLIRQKFKKSSLNIDLDSTAEDEEHLYSNLPKCRSSDKDCCKNDLEEKENYVDIAILGDIRLE